MNMVTQNLRLKDSYDLILRCSVNVYAVLDGFYQKQYITL